MGVFLAILAVVFFGGLVLSAAMHPVRSHLSHAELKRRANKSEAAVLELDRYELYPALVTLLRTIRALLLVLVTCLFIGAFGWAWGILFALIVAVNYGALARLAPVQKPAESLYGSIEPGLLDFVDRFERVIRAFREPATRLTEKRPQVHSREELAELIEASASVIGPNERLLLASALAFPEKTVASIMTPRKAIKTVKKGEFLGPLVLDELHALGHSRLPVIDGDLDHVVGLLHLQDMLSLDIKNSATVENVMESKVYYIRKDDSLEHALAIFLKVRHHLLIVIDDESATVGLVTLDDLIEVLVGRKIETASR